MPKIQYKEIKFQQKSLDLIELVNQVVEEYQAVCDKESREKDELRMLERNYDRAVAFLESEE